MSWTLPRCTTSVLHVTLRSRHLSLGSSRSTGFNGPVCRRRLLWTIVRNLVSEFLTYLSGCGIHQHVIPVAALWQNGMVGRHGQLLAEIIHAILNETRVVGKPHQQDVLLMASLTPNRRLGGSGYSPRAMVYGHAEQIRASGLSHFLEKLDDAVMTRQDPAHVKRMEYRNIAFKAVIDLDCPQRWKEAIKYFSRPIDAKYVLPGKTSILLEKRSASTSQRRPGEKEGVQSFQSCKTY